MEVEINKRQKRPLSSHLDHIVPSIKELLYSRRENFFLAGPTWKIPRGQDCPFCVELANQNAGFAYARIQLYNGEVTQQDVRAKKTVNLV